VIPPLSTDGPGSTGPAENDSNIHDHDNPQQAIARFLRLLLSPGDVFEVRAPKCRTKPGGDFKQTVSGLLHI